MLVNSFGTGASSGGAILGAGCFNERNVGRREHMPISESELHELLRTHRRQNWDGIQTPEWQERIVNDMVKSHAPAVLERIAPYWKIPPRALILDVGSGVGGFVVACRERGYRAFGVEPDRIGKGSSVTAVQIASKRLDEVPFAVGIGEQLPFRDSAFDLVVLDQVIEHVVDQAAVLREAFRVVKPEGAVYIACPNYLCFYEPHYKVKFLPLMPKALGRLYLRARSRSPVLLDQIQYTTNWRVHRLLRGMSASMARDLNTADFERKCASGQFASLPARTVQRLVQLPLIGPAIMQLVKFYIRLVERGTAVLACSQQMQEAERKAAA